MCGLLFTKASAMVAKRPSLQCKKEAVTDAVKRTLRNFGNVLGNCLYDKSYTQEIVKIKVPPVRCPTICTRFTLDSRLSSPSSIGTSFIVAPSSI